MCIRDSREEAEEAMQDTFLKAFRYLPGYRGDSSFKTWLYRCLLYTSDAADERSSVDLGGRRIIKKKRNEDIVDACDEPTQRSTLDDNT